ncbi:hypothetical protein SCE1572_23435 [Sorangium cellulosum So0157-2]|uniref:Uncharacterized protein n=1 Tax=Sorangium cellulosum So0157-2 TaxID=1254432 RepID=S4XXT7_SORCE|nr:hypothetical protein [Sorangium cellulosum]AGP37176.1 hypothetical protein SCE1572_23435 [Sorangium cellulosum So0157-2]
MVPASMTGFTSVSITLTRESARSSRSSRSSPSWRIRSSMPLCVRSSVVMRRSLAIQLPADRIIAGNRRGPTTMMPTMTSTITSPKLKPNTGAS